MRRREPGPFDATIGVLSLHAAAARGRGHPRRRRQRPRDRVVPQRPVGRVQDQRGHAARAAHSDPDHGRRARGDGCHDVGDGRVGGRRCARRRRRRRRRRRAGRAGADRARPTRTSASACAGGGSSSSTGASARSSTRTAVVAKFGVRPESIPDYPRSRRRHRRRVPGAPRLGLEVGGDGARPLRPLRGDPAARPACGTSPACAAPPSCRRRCRSTWNRRPVPHHRHGRSRHAGRRRRRVAMGRPDGEFATCATTRHPGPGRTSVSRGRSRS